MADNIIVTVPPRAADWMGRVLRDVGIPAAGALSVAIGDKSDLNLNLMKRELQNSCCLYDLIALSAVG